MNQSKSKPKLKMYDPGEVPSKETKASEVPQGVSLGNLVKPQATEGPKKDNYVPLDDLPSLYRFYGLEDRILARPMTVSEVKQLASMNEENADYIVSDIVSRTVKGIDTSEILRADKYYILFWLRANTYKSAGYDIDYQCPHCKKMSNYKFDVSVFNVTYVKETVNDLSPITLPESKDTLAIKFLRIRDEKRIKDFLSMAERAGRTYDREILEIAATLGSINGAAKSIRENYEFVDALNPVDFSYLMSYLEDITFGISNTVKATCSLCGEVSPVAIRFREEFFIPKFKF